MTEEEKLRAAWNIYDACLTGGKDTVLRAMDALINEIRTDTIADVM